MFRNRLAQFGRMIFGRRLFVGLAFALFGLEVLQPRPLFAERYLAGQVLGIAMIVVGMALRGWGSGYAGKHTRSALISAPRLVTAGPFAYVRNPIYVGTIVLGFGMCSVNGDPLAHLLAALAFVVLYFGIVPAEEDYLTKQFGPDYQRYQSAVPRLLPRVRPWPGRIDEGFRWRAVWGECGIALLLVGIYAALVFEEYLDRVFG
jgi:protein-S-isoprenylcysteine O-methyltransferase Ste14